MNTRRLLLDLARAAHGLRLDDPGIRLTWPDGWSLNSQLLARCKRHKPALVAALREGPTGPDDPCWVVLVLGDRPLWSTWMHTCAARFGMDGPANNAAGYAVFVDLRRAA